MSSTAEWYSRAAGELQATSELQLAWARGVAADSELLALIDGLPREHRQPSLLFAVAAWCGAPPAAYPAWREFVLAHWAAIGPAAASHRTQTNEVGRCIPLLIGLSRFSGPIALLELGAAAGLCLAVDRYSYRFDDGTVLAPALGHGSPLLSSSTAPGSPSSPGSTSPVRSALTLKDGPSTSERAGSTTDTGRRTMSQPLDTASRPPHIASRPPHIASRLLDIPRRMPEIPHRMPEIVWRAGVDLAPLDVRDENDVRWLEALLPPDRPTRLARLRAAIATVRADPPRVVAGDALATLPALAAEARAAAPDATLVVASLGTAVYLPPADRAALPDAVAALGAHLVAFESAAAVPGIPERLARLHAVETTPFVLSVDGEPLAYGTAHGDRLIWLSESSPARQPELPDSAT